MVDDSLTSALVTTWTDSTRPTRIPIFGAMPSRRRTSKDGPAKLAKRMSAAGAWCSFAARVRFSARSRLPTRQRPKQSPRSGSGWTTFSAGACWCRSCATPQGNHMMRMIMLAVATIIIPTAPPHQQHP